MVLDVAPDAPLDDGNNPAQRAARRPTGRTTRPTTKGTRPRTSPPMRGADPAIVLVPGVGMFSFWRGQARPPSGRGRVLPQRDQRHARRGGDLKLRPDRRKREVPHRVLGARRVAKLRRRPGPEAARGRIALVTGGGSGIGRATAQRLAAEGACVVVADRDAAAARTVADAIGTADAAIAAVADVTSEDDIAAALASAALAFGGVDLVVNNAGLSVSKPLADTTVADWDILHDVMGRGLLPGLPRGGEGHGSAQGMGGDIIYIVSKNGVFAGTRPTSPTAPPRPTRPTRSGCSPPSSLAPVGVRVNGINPDGVVRGSGIFAAWPGRQARRGLRRSRGRARRLLRPAHPAEERGAASSTSPPPSSPSLRR